MLGSIFYKEFLKIRWIWLTLAALNAMLMAYVFIETRWLFAMDHAEIVWYRVIHLGHLHYGLMQYAPAVTGLLTACFQYFPEMAGERLRLSLHLPVSPHRLVLAHVLVGLAAMAVIIGLDMVLLALVTARYFPVESVIVALYTALPWALAGLAAYVGVTFGLLEPNYRHKLFNLVVAAGIVGLFLRPAEQGAYSHVLAAIIAPILIMVPAVLLPAYHFRFRRVS